MPNVEYEKFVDILPQKVIDGSLRFELNAKTKEYFCNLPEGATIVIGGSKEPTLRIYDKENKLEYDHRFIGDEKRSVTYLKLYGFLEEKRVKESGALGELAKLLDIAN